MSDEANRDGRDDAASGRPSLNSYAVLFGAQIAIGAAAIFARYALHGAGPIAVSALRLTIAAVPLFLIGWRRSKQLSIPGKHELLFAICGVVLGVHFATWIASLQFTSVAVSTLLVCTSPVWTALYDRAILKKKMGWKFWLAFVTAGLGVAMIVCTDSGRPPVEGREGIGNLLAVIGSIAFACYLIAIRSISNLYPTIVVVGRTYSWSALSLLITTFAVKQMPPGNDVESWGGIIAMALVSQILGHTGLNASLRWFTPSTVAFSTLLEPVFAAVLAAVLFAESLSWQVLIGSVVVLLSLGAILKLEPEGGA